jgi:hypothetical protein
MTRGAKRLCDSAPECRISSTGLGQCLLNLEVISQQTTMQRDGPVRAIDGLEGSQTLKVADCQELQRPYVQPQQNGASEQQSDAGLDDLSLAGNTQAMLLFTVPCLHYTSRKTRTEKVRSRRDLLSTTSVDPPQQTKYSVLC